MRQSHTRETDRQGVGEVCLLLLLREQVGVELIGLQNCAWVPAWVPADLPDCPSFSRLG